MTTSESYTSPPYIVTGESSIAAREAAHTAEMAALREQLAATECERDGVREELARTVEELADVRATAANRIFDAIDALDALSATETPAATSRTTKASTAVRAELRTHYGPTATDPDHGKEWHYDCGGEVASFKEGRICSRCQQGETLTDASGEATHGD